MRDFVLPLRYFSMEKGAYAYSWSLIYSYNSQNPTQTTILYSCLMGCINLLWITYSKSRECA